MYMTIKLKDTIVLLIMALLVVLLVSPIPIAHGISSRVLVFPYLMLLLLYLSKYKPANKANILLIAIAFSYLVTIYSIIPLLITDNSLLIQSFFSLITIISLLFINKNDVFISNKLFLLLSLLLFIIIYINVPELFNVVFFSETRLEALHFQKDTNFIYGINKFLFTLFIFTILSFTLKLNLFIKIMFVILYFYCALFLVSRTNTIMSLFFILILFTELNLSKYIKYLIYMIFILIFTILLNYIIDNYFDSLEALYYRFDYLINDFYATPRGYIFEQFMNKVSSGLPLYGYDLYTSLNNINDFDNTILFITASGGFIGLLSFISFIILIIILILKSKLSNLYKALIVSSYLLFINVNVIVTEFSIFYPVVVILISSNNRKLVHG